ncbi:MAG TPA: serine/threonine-protein kinase [Polyangia bacterium]|nr:serine/threonine-protein kinase [Polyangia bacterium]
MVQLGETIGNYRVVAQLGEGGMGSVFLAEHPVIGRKAALKVIHPQHARNPEVVARFVNEAAAINRVGHPHIVEVTDFGRTPGGDFYFAMEYLEGRALSDLIAREAPFAPERAIAIAIQIADALGASHASGVIHRDVKPENVFLVTRGDDHAFVKVLDFGLAKLVSPTDARPRATRSGIVMGTPYYMSPEQCEARGEIDHRADIYSLGVVLFEMLTAHLPFGGAAAGEVLMKHLTMQPPLARSLVPDLPEALDTILHRALAKRPADRFATMELFREALRAPLEHAAAHPPSWTAGELSRRARAAQPMSRAEIARRQSPPAAGPTTPGAPAGHVFDEALDRVPRHKAPRNLALAAAAAMVAGLLAAGAGHAGAFKRTVLLAPGVVLAASQHAVLAASQQALAAPAPRPKPADTVSLTFTSDPPGATVVAADGAIVGLTPLSIQVPPSERPARYRFELPGFATKEMESIPQVSSSMFVRLEPDEARGSHASDAAVARRRARSSFQRSLDADGVLAPSFDK